MNTSLKVGIAAILVAVSAGLPLALAHRARLETDARREVLRQQEERLSLLVRENGRLSNLVAQAAPPLTEEQLRELLRLRDERRHLAEQTNPMAGLRVGNNPASPAEIHRALSAEMVDAMKHVLPGLEPALRRYALAHPDRAPGNLADLADYFPMVGGRRMPGLQTFEFARDDGPRPGDALLLRADVPSDDVKARIYGFSDGRVIEVTAEDGRFDAWERQHMTSKMVEP